jgi:hypothetical protein
MAVPVLTPASTLSAVVLPSSGNPADVAITLPLGIYSSNTPNHIERLLDIIELKDGVKNTFKKKKRKKKEEDSTIPLDSLQVDVDTTSVID